MKRFLIPFLATLILAGMHSSAAVAATSQNGDHTLVVIRGRAVCLDATGRQSESLFGCNDGLRRFGFAGKDGRLYKLSPSDAMTEMLGDARVRERDLQISARLFAGDRLEIIKVQSIKQGKLYDIYYFCEVCNIRAYAPGPCPCCRNELEFKETPQ